MLHVVSFNLLTWRREKKHWVDARRLTNQFKPCSHCGSTGSFGSSKYHLDLTPQYPFMTSTFGDTEIMKMMSLPSQHEALFPIFHSQMRHSMSLNRDEKSLKNTTSRYVFDQFWATLWNDSIALAYKSYFHHSPLAQDKGISWLLRASKKCLRGFSEIHWFSSVRMRTISWYLSCRINYVCGLI